jgi:aquaporin TIP
VEHAPLQRAFAEFVGTFALVFIGCGAIVSAAGIHDPTLVGIALAHGLAIGVMVSAVGHISGGHFNPAVTFGFVVTRRITLPLAALYWATQLVAAVVAAALVKWIYPDALTDAVKLGTPVLRTGIGTGAGLVVEAILTFFLVWVVFATAADPGGTFKSIAGLAIGLTITLDILMGGPITGAAVNPARAFGPEVIQNAWSNAWIWYLGPLLGGALAALAYDWLYLRPPGLAVVGTPESGLDEPRPGETALS